jgi:rubredoxin
MSTPISSGGGMVYTCTLCGYEYDEKVEKVLFEELPDDWRCPICKAPKSAFEKSE